MQSAYIFDRVILCLKPVDAGRHILMDHEIAAVKPGAVIGSPIVPEQML